MNSQHPSIILICAALAIVFSDRAQAQGEGEIVDKVIAQRTDALPAAAPGNAQQLPEIPEAGEADATPLDIEIQVVRLITHHDLVDKKGGFEITAPVMISGDLRPPDGLTAKLETEYVGKRISMAFLETITKDIITLYREGDFPLVDVYLPEQDISTGKLQVVVREALLGKVTVDGATHSSPDYLLKQIRVNPGERINSRTLEGDVEWLNSNPSRSIELVYERGDVDGTSNILLKTEDLSPFASYLSYGNTGVEATGFHEWAAGFNISNLLGTEHSAGYSFSGDADLDNLNAHTLIYEAPLPWRHRLQLIGAYVTSESGAGTPALPLDVDGESIQASANYKIMLAKIDGRHRQNLTIGIDYKSTNTDILFGGQSFFDSVAEVLQFRGGYDLTVGDDLGYTRFDLGGVYSPGEILNSNTDEAFQQLRAQSSADYWYLAGEIERYFVLPKDWGLKLTTEGQWTNDRLISTEQLLAGGYRSVRGVDENIARGDSGILAGAELVAPPFSVLKHGGEDIDSLNLFLFADSAWLSSTGSDPSEPDQSLQTSGAGLNYRLGEHGSLRASYGWVLGDSGIEDAGPGKWHFGLTISY